METTTHTVPSQPSAVDVAAERWRAGDPSAAREVWELCGGRLLRLARALTRSRATAEDAVQEAFLRAWRAIGRYNPAKPFEPWLNTIVVRECRRAARRELRRHEPLKPEDEGSPGGVLFEAVEELPQAIKETVALHYLIGYNVEETAQAL
jgi:RNA polymerase sigma-70 factor (ECF subfamily)